MKNVKNLTLWLTGFTVALLVATYIVASYLVTNITNLIDYAIFGGVVATVMLLALSAWSTYLLVWVQKNKATAQNTLDSLP